MTRIGHLCAAVAFAGLSLAVGAPQTLAEWVPVGDTPTATPTSTATATPTNTPVPQGGACADTAQCVAGLFCSDSVCCDTACAVSGQRCDVPGHEGTCLSGPAKAPAASNTGLFAILAALVLMGIVTLRARRRV
jgi:hypothetical protein